MKRLHPGIQSHARDFTGRQLSEQEQEYVVEVILEWIRRQMKRGEA